MDPPPPAPPLQSHNLNYADSLDSSPRSRNTDSWDEPQPPTTRLRLMCSYGGHIVPRPHDKSLCYVGGDTRIVVVDRQTSLSDLSNRLSKTLLNGRPFTLKYQLPSEDLDSLISLTTDEDLDNMIDEYDRTANHSGASSKPSRLRLFLFPLKPESSQSMGPILDISANKSEDWFLNALNGASGMLNRGFSDSASVNCLLGLDDDSISGGAANNLESGSRDVEASVPANGKNAKQGGGVGGGNGQDVQSVPDSPMLENSSSFGSTSSSPSLANSPPIRVHVEDGGGGGGGGGIGVQDQKMGIEEQFAQMTVGGGVGQKQDDGAFAVLSSPPPMPTTIVASAAPLSTATNYLNRVVSDDERSDHGAPAGHRKPAPPQPQLQPLTLPPQSQQPKSSGVLDLPSPDSVSSDNSLSNAMSRPKPVIYQDPVVQIPSANARFPANLVDPKLNLSDPTTRIQMQQQVHDSGYVLQSQFDHQQQQLQQHHQQQAQQQHHQQEAQQQYHQQQAQQQHQQQQAQQQHQQQQAQQQHQQQQAQQAHQFIHAGTHYIQHHPGSVPIPAYYPVYPPQQQQQHHHHPQLDQQQQQQYQVYYMPARQPQPYATLPVQQSNISDSATPIPSSHSQTPPNPAISSSSTAYSQMRNAQIVKPEMAAPAGVYRTATTAAPPLVQVPSAQHQQQYVGYPTQIHHPSQSAVPSSGGNASYAYEYATDPSHALELIAKSFKNFKLLVLSSCEGFSTDGLAAIAANCRNLRELDLHESDVEDLSGHWLSHFPDTYTSLVSLNIACLGSELSFSALERLVGRCPNLRSLRLNRSVPLDRLANLLRQAPRLSELGTGAYSAELRPDIFTILSGAFSRCKELKSLSGFWDVVPPYLTAIYSICPGLTSLNLSYSNIQSADLVKLVSECPNLQRLWVLDYIEDVGLNALAESCKDLRELRVFPSDPFVVEPNVSLTEQGLISVSEGCPKLHSVLYFCRQMSNDALITIARNQPNFTCFRLCIIEPKIPDYLTLQPLDVGFGAIVENCKNLRRLSISGLLTDRVFDYIGTYGKNLEMLSVAFAGDSDLGLHHILSGCDNLRKLEIRDCPFGDKALLANAAKLETMRSLWMSSCSVSYGACKLLGQRLPRLNVEVIDERGHPESRPESSPVEKLYIYRSVAGPRFDMPGFVWTMDEDSALRVT